MDTQMYFVGSEQIKEKVTELSQLLIKSLHFDNKKNNKNTR